MSIKKITTLVTALCAIAGLSAITTGCGYHTYGYGGPPVVHVYHGGYGGAPIVVHHYGGYGGGYGGGGTVTHVYHNGYGGVSHVVVHHYR